MKTIMVLNGPNLNLLGRRQPKIYGHETLEDVTRICEAACADGFGIRLLQSNHEGQIIDWIHEARETSCGIVIKPGAFTHTSVAILDALNIYEAAVIEVHFNQVHKREAFRHHSYVSHRADGVIAGLGIEGYAAGVRRICQLSAD
ncbi:MAG TPA: type II 3-dehydroquinate dehydratase [Amaricoccus sp.]|uniref:type II 3-dehydroquinate dehydratase n=1 Tax=Amaricoccus sp. TaxID=1872485 RepID=UPI002BA503A2|nr:type II 3-dehydroquinate dehydratase [Amaricoccus sp.]HMQ95007.1 type II 3-dehydroquinate dehydratase [Amaricoccus sp.]HMR37812.1 type II 3-dehydroquinate dehydratase [Paracoccus sp. (in: a-proteobacteria)]HMR54810.1 type II 3-dehydroquinate dehydratase [Amaricoccus sp.]HMU01852.1 type II 3-dehydroquinate dehydratase [Amaricoccus sp.]